jgi:hypothetical protein
MSSSTPPVQAPVPQPSPRRARPRRRLLLTLGAISLGWKVVVLTLGAAVPRWMIDDGVRALPSDLQPYARDAKRSAAALWNGPIERYGVVRMVRVVSVQRVPGSGAASGAARRCGGLGARVRAYTYFGVPYSEARMVCDSGVVEYRVFRHGPWSAVPQLVPNVGPATPASPAELTAAPVDARGSD